MTLYIGVDIHARQQTLSYLDTSDGTTGQVRLDHERDDIRGSTVNLGRSNHRDRTSQFGYPCGEVHPNARYKRALRYTESLKKNR